MFKDTITQLQPNSSTEIETVHYEYERLGPIPDHGETNVASNLMLTPKAQVRHDHESLDSVTGDEVASTKPDIKDLDSSGKLLAHGIVKYGWIAERRGQLEAKAGDAVLLLAHCGSEWCIARPTNPSSGEYIPGWILFSFIEMKDVLTGKLISDATPVISRLPAWNKSIHLFKEIYWKSIESETSSSRHGLGLVRERAHTTTSRQRNTNHKVA